MKKYLIAGLVVGLVLGIVTGFGITYMVFKKPSGPTGISVMLFPHAVSPGPNLYFSQREAIIMHPYIEEIKYVHVGFDKDFTIFIIEGPEPIHIQYNVTLTATIYDKEGNIIAEGEKTLTKGIVIKKIEIPLKWKTSKEPSKIHKVEVGFKTPTPKP